LKVGVNINAHVQLFKDHTTVEIVNCLDFTEQASQDFPVQSITNSKPRLMPSDESSGLVVAYYNTPLSALDRPQDITELGLVRASYIKCEFLLSTPLIEVRALKILKI
jgi:hypothetical protein